MSEVPYGVSGGASRGPCRVTGVSQPPGGHAIVVPPSALCPCREVHRIHAAARRDVAEAATGEGRLRPAGGGASVSGGRSWDGGEGTGLSPGLGEGEL